jgi:hypothetical protein
MGRTSTMFRIFNWRKYPTGSPLSPAKKNLLEAITGFSKMARCKVNE